MFHTLFNISQIIILNPCYDKIHKKQEVRCHEELYILTANPHIAIKIFNTICEMFHKSKPLHSFRKILSLHWRVIQWQLKKRKLNKK